MEQVNTDLLQFAEEKAKEDRKNWLKKLWSWGIGTFGIVGLVVICVLFPAIIPFLFSAVSALFGAITRSARSLLQRRYETRPPPNSS